MTAEHTVVRLQRTISAPPERVYGAWLEPELIRQWLAPGASRSPATGVTKLPALRLPGGTVITHSRGILGWIDQRNG